MIKPSVSNFIKCSRVNIVTVNFFIIDIERDILEKKKKKSSFLEAWCIEDIQIFTFWLELQTFFSTVLKSCPPPKYLIICWYTTYNIINTMEIENNALQEYGSICNKTTYLKYTASLTQITWITCIIKKKEGKESHLFVYVCWVLSNSSIFL